MPDVISIRLASNSPRRRELMALGNWNVTSSVPDVDEARLAGEAPADYVLRLAQAKALAALIGSDSGSLVIGADTAVVDGTSVLGKPTDAGEAARMLKQLRGRVHQVFTGVAVMQRASGSRATDLCVTDVPMRPYTDAEIDAYVASGDPLDKAGAYGIQHAGFRPVQELAGCFASVMGMPLCHTIRALAHLQIAVEPDLPARCQAHLSYDCPVSSAILRGEPAG